MLELKSAIIFLNINKYNTQNRNTINTTLTNIYKNTRHFLKTHEDIVVVKSDKGKSVILMNKDNYNDNVMTMLKDRSTYKFIHMVIRHTFYKISTTD